MSCDATSSQSLPAGGPDQDQPTPSMLLLTVVRGLFALGTAWLGIAQRGNPRLAVQYTMFQRFGTKHIALIVARLQRGLAIAAALEERILRRAKQIDSERPQPAPRTPPEEPPARAERKPRLTRDQDDAALLLGVPSAAEIAEMVRRKPIGRVLEDICRDIGLEPADPGWNDLVFALCAHGGDIDRVFDEYAERTVDMDQPTAEEIADMDAGGMVEIHDSMPGRMRYLGADGLWSELLGTGPPDLAEAA